MSDLDLILRLIGGGCGGVVLLAGLVVIACRYDASRTHNPLDADESKLADELEGRDGDG
jgi:hypothetical protein